MKGAGRTMATETKPWHGGQQHLVRHGSQRRLDNLENITKGWEEEGLMGEGGRNVVSVAGRGRVAAIPLAHGPQPTPRGIWLRLDEWPLA